MTSVICSTYTAATILFYASKATLVLTDGTTGCPNRGHSKGVAYTHVEYTDASHSAIDIT
jgi:hypothetical protein